MSTLLMPSHLPSRDKGDEELMQFSLTSWDLSYPCWWILDDIQMVLVYALIKTCCNMLHTVKSDINARVNTWMESLSKSNVTQSSLALLIVMSIHMLFDLDWSFKQFKYKNMLCWFSSVDCPSNSIVIKKLLLLLIYLSISYFKSMRIKSCSH